MEYQVIIHENIGVVRPKTDGITDTEWRHGCRVFYRPDVPVSMYKLYKYMDEETNITIITLEDWRRMITSMDDPELISEDYFVPVFSRWKVRDKWESIPEIY